MTNTNKMREQFEAAYTAYCGKMGVMSYTAFHRAREAYINSATELAWQMWQASRAAVVVELPPIWEQGSNSALGQACAQIRTADIEAIEAQGLKVAP